jgi:hypothetical protein
MSRTVKLGLVVWVLVAGWLLWQQGCDTTLEAIVVADGAVTVRNQTEDDWLDVRIWLNEHYAGGARQIPRGGFIREPAGRFVAAQGQTFDITKAGITSIVVLGRTPDGTRVRVAWGKPLLH